LAKQASKYLTVGVIGTLINLVVLYVSVEFFHLHYLFGACLGFVLAISNNFYFNKKWTFHNHSNHYLKQYEKYFLVSLACAGLGLGILFVLVEFFNFWYILAQIIGIILAGIVSFLSNKCWSFDDKA
jgi:putative flippase GtrA